MEFITNRTVRDVQLADAARMVKVQKGKPLNQDDIKHLKRGTCTIETLNRLELNAETLTKTLRDEFYFVNIEPRVTWEYIGIFDEGDHRRFLNKIDTLNSFWNGANADPTPNYMFSWQNMNTIENILLTIFNGINNMIANQQICGTFNCGDENN